MSENDNNSQGQKPKTTPLRLLVISATTIIIVLAIAFVIIPYDGPYKRNLAIRLLCGSNLNGLGKAMLIYAQNHNDQYPTPNQWCDLLIKDFEVTKKMFRCSGDRKGLCSYAMNPNCEPNSLPDTVLLFETKGGWNQFGGPELLTTENHKGRGCNIVFNDEHVEFVETGQLENLKYCTM